MTERTDEARLRAYAEELVEQRFPNGIRPKDLHCSCGLSLAEHGPPCLPDKLPEVIALRPQTEQPAPVPGGPPILPMVIADLEERGRKGLAVYGMPLTAYNGRDALRDAYEEVLDLACYLRQRLAEEGR